MSAQMSTLVENPSMDVEDHPQIRDVNAEHQQRLSRVEKICQAIATATGSPTALMLAIVFQILWVVVGSLSGRDPYPFVFLLTVSNIVQLILIFVIAVAQRQSSEHAELRAEADHEHISRLLNHQEVQEELLLRMAEQTRLDISDIKRAITQLLQPA